MKIPNKVMIAGIGYDIIMKDELYNAQTHDSLNAQISYSDREIKIATQQCYILGDSDHHVSVNDDVMQRAFFHELWHGYCNAISETKITNEQNACTFAILCVEQISDGIDFRNWQKKAFSNMIDMGFVKLTDVQKKKMLWLIDKTTYVVAED